MVTEKRKLTKRKSVVQLRLSLSQGLYTRYRQFWLALPFNSILNVTSLSKSHLAFRLIRKLKRNLTENHGTQRKQKKNKQRSYFFQCKTRVYFMLFKTAFFRSTVFSFSVTNMQLLLFCKGFKIQFLRRSKETMSVITVVQESSVSKESKCLYSTRLVLEIAFLCYKV